MLAVSSRGTLKLSADVVLPQDRPPAIIGKVIETRGNGSPAAGHFTKHIKSFFKTLISVNYIYSFLISSDYLYSQVFKLFGLYIQ